MTAKSTGCGAEGGAGGFGDGLGGGNGGEGGSGGGGPGGADGGGGGRKYRMPQSEQSVPSGQIVYSAPGPPSSQSPSEMRLPSIHASRQKEPNWRDWQMPHETLQ